MKKRKNKKNDWQFGGKYYRFNPIRIVGDIIVIGGLLALDRMSSPDYVRVFLFLLCGYVFLRLWEIIRGGLW